MMKKLLFFSLLVALTTGFTACGGDDETPEQQPVIPNTSNNPENPGDPGDPDDPDDPGNSGENPDSLYGSNNIKDPVVTGGCSGLSMTSVTLYGYVNSKEGVMEKGIYYSEDEQFSNREKSIGYTIDREGRRFSVGLYGLKPDTRYYYYAYLNDGSDKVKEGEVCSFTTKGLENVIAVERATSITHNSAVIPCQYRNSDMLNQLQQLGGYLTFGVAYSTKESDLKTTDGQLAKGAKTAVAEYYGAYMQARLTDLPASTTVYYAPYTYFSTSYYGNNGKYYLGSVSKFTTLDKPKPSYDSRAVDLGLPSGTMWASCNVGADSPEEYGLFFAWGETVGYGFDTYQSFDWSTYKWCNGSETTMTKYCTNSNYGTVDNKTVLDLEDDAAHVNWGGNWRMPTFEEITELLNNTTNVWTTQNGVFGQEFTGTNGHSIFLPAASSSWSVEFGLIARSRGNYWSSTLYYYPDGAYYLKFDSGGADWNDYERCYGQSVRPVCKK